MRGAEGDLRSYRDPCFSLRWSKGTFPIAAHSADRNAAIASAYATGAYTYREIAEYFGVHLATVGRIVREQMQRCEN